MMINPIPPANRSEAVGSANDHCQLPRGHHWPFGLILVGALLMTGVIAADLDTRDPDQAADLEHFRQIRTALDAYRQDHDGQLPDWLSDLFPKYLSDPEVLLCPAAERTGRAQLFGNDDPRLRTSYIYEFNARPASDFHVADPTVRATMKDWKTKQMETFGTAVPLVRCLNHERVLNLAVSGDIFETALFWETDPNTLDLMARLGVKPAEVEGARELAVEVMDQATGEAVKSARVRMVARGPTGYLPARDWMTDAAGRCRVALPEGTLRELRLEVTHADYVTGMISWQQEEGLTPPQTHRVALERGITIGGRVQDPAGDPIAGVEVSLHAGYRPRLDGAGLTVASTVIPSATTDDQGEWRIGGVSPSLYRAYAGFTHPRFRRLQLVTRPPEDPAQGGFTLAGLTNRTAVTLMQPQVHVRIEAVDQETLRPIESFTVLQAFASRSGLAWDPDRQMTGREGHAVLRLEEEHAQLPALLRVHAEGYRPVISPRIQETPAEQTIQLALPKTRPIDGRVVDTAGHGVSGASVGWLTDLGSLVMGADGLEAGLGSTVVRSGDHGSFRLPDAADAIGLVAWHETGLTEVGLPDFLRERVLVLSAWGRVAGTLPPGTRGDPAVALIGATEHLPRLFPSTLPGVLQLEAGACLAEADEAGRFLADRVPPGRRVLWHPVLVGSEFPPMEAFYSFNGRWVEVKPGETTQVEVAPRAVRAQLLPPDDHRSTAEEQAAQTMMLQRYGLASRPPGRMIYWPQALGWVRFESLDSQNGPPFEALVTFSHDGQFRLEGVPAGRQRIRLRVFQPPQLLGTAELEVLIPESGAPVMLGEAGTVRLLEPRRAAPGESLPAWVGQAFTGGLVDLSRFRGQPVWLHFWTSWSGAGQGSFRSLPELLDKLGDATPANVLSVNLDLDPALARRALERVEPPGWQAHDGGWLTSSLAEACGVESLPWIVRIDADGRLLSSAPAERYLSTGGSW
jgi:hypothetical protein